VEEAHGRPKMTHRPFLQITLSCRPIGLELGEEGRNITCQYTLIKRRRGKDDPVSEESDEGENVQIETDTAGAAVDVDMDIGMGMGLYMDDEEDLGVAVDRKTLAPAAISAVQSTKKTVEDGQKRKSISDRDAGAKRSKNGSNGAKGSKEKVGQMGLARREPRK
jgi:hypothetical protein